tara:strand:+ start:85 stop:327 length:243 start_codon:yes stop_codon:yes gene_type:complete
VADHGWGEENKSMSLKILASRRLGISLYTPLYTNHENLGVFKPTKPSKYWVLKISIGASRDRTDDLLLAKQMLSQLSYSP